MNLKAQRQISKKRCFGKYCPCDQACQFSALQGTPCRSYLENLTIDDKFINKRVRLFMHQNVWRRKNLLIRHSRAAKQLFNYSFKKVQKQPPDVFCKKSVVKNFANFTGKHPCWSHFLNKVPGLQPASFLKKDSSAFQHKCFPVKSAKLLRTPI